MDTSAISLEILELHDRLYMLKRRMASTFSMFAVGLVFLGAGFTDSSSSGSLLRTIGMGFTYTSSVAILYFAILMTKTTECITEKLRAHAFQPPQEAAEPPAYDQLRHTSVVTSSSSLTGSQPARLPQEHLPSSITVSPDFYEPADPLPPSYVTLLARSNNKPDETLET